MQQADEVRATHQGRNDEQLSFQEMSAKGFLKRLSEHVEVHYVTPAL